ncbi:MAG: FGGY-family carbohydrate kinase, partial [Atribacterota bacterium]
MSYLGLDVGTTRWKSCVFDDKGRVLAAAAREYGFSNPFPGWAEQDSEMVWSLVKEIVREAVFHATQEPRALAISAQGEAVIFVDSKGKILRPTILGMDMRAVEECEILSRQFGAEELLHLSGVPLHPITSLSKIFWVKRHQPEIFKLTEKFLLYEDFIFWKLGGLPVTDYSMACKTMLFDIDTQEWSGHLLDFLEITPERLAVCCPSGTVIGTVRRPIADELGLPPDLKLVMGGHDQCCAPLGAGSIQEGVASDNMGTAEIFSVPVDDHSVAQKIGPHNFSCY